MMWYNDVDLLTIDQCNNHVQGMFIISNPMSKSNIFKSIEGIEIYTNLQIYPMTFVSQLIFCLYPWSGFIKPSTDHYQTTFILFYDLFIFVQTVWMTEDDSPGLDTAVTDGLAPVVSLNFDLDIKWLQRCQYSLVHCKLAIGHKHLMSKLIISIVPDCIILMWHQFHDTMIQ